MPNSSSNAMTSSTVSRLSAPRSSMKLAFSVTFASSTPRCSTTIFFTRSAMSLMCGSLCLVELGRDMNVTSAPSLSIGNRPSGNMRFPRPAIGEATASDHGHAAIHVQGLPGDVGGLVAGQIDHRGRHVAGGAQPAGRDGAQEPLPSAAAFSASVIGVAMKPGATQLTVMPREATSAPAPWSCRSCRPWRRHSWPGPGLPVTPTIEVMPMMRPQRRFIMPRSAARARRNGA